MRRPYGNRMLAVPDVSEAAEWYTRAGGAVELRLGRTELKPHSDWDDGRPETELNFKFYRPATNKICGISDETAAFLRGFF